MFSPTDVASSGVCVSSKIVLYRYHLIAVFLSIIIKNIIYFIALSFYLNNGKYRLIFVVSMLISTYLCVNNSNFLAKIKQINK